MKEQKYNIVLYVPLGKRYGTMTVCMEREMIRGEINIMQHLEQFEGKQYPDGSVEISGRLKTLVRLIYYKGSGMISPTNVRLLLDTGEDIFEIEGIATGGD